MLPLKLIKLHLIVILTSTFSFAQTLTNSPYSRYGIGDIINNNSAQSEAMGGLDQALQYSAWINYTNPASYSAFELTTFQTGAKISQTEQSSNVLKQKVRNGNMTSLALAFPVKRGWGVSFGLLPYSSVGYAMSTVASTSQNEEISYVYNGSGGLNRIYLGSGIQPFSGKPDSSWLKGFSLGVNVAYLFGSMDYERRAIFTTATTNYYYNLREINIYNLSDFYLDYGLQYKTRLSKKWLLQTGLTASPSSKIDGKHSGLAQTYYLSNGIEYPKDTVNSFDDQKGSITLPSRWGVGIQLNFSDKIAFGIDYKTQNWKNFKAFDAADKLKNSQSISIGAQFIPNPANGRGFWQHVQYRAGVNYASTYLSINATELQQQSVSIGAGFPIIKSLSTLNIALQYGSRGTLENNLIKEKFYAISLGLSFSDKWFIKRKFD